MQACLGFDWEEWPVVTILGTLTVGLTDYHVTRISRAMGSTPNKGHCTVLRVQPLLRCVNIWVVYLSPSRLLIAYLFAYAHLLIAYLFAYACFLIAYSFAYARLLIAYLLYQVDD